MRLLVAVLTAVALGLPLFAQQPQPILPDRRLTPGDAFDVTAGDVCTPGYSRKVRNVPQSVKEELYREYGITAHPPHAFEVDHLVPLELGGSNSIKNLWPESYLTSPWNARVKDRLEARLHTLVCSGKLDLKTAQQAIASNWITAYQRYVGSVPKAMGRPSEDERAEIEVRPSPAAGHVWVNTKSGKFWLPGSRYYGKTREGEYMSEAEARAKGYSPANGTGR